MAQVDNARGFRYEKRAGGKECPMMKFLITDAAYALVEAGDPLHFDVATGKVEAAASGDIMAGVAASAPYLDESDGTTKVVDVIPALPDVLFRVQDAKSSPTQVQFGTLVDISDTTNGAYEIDSGVSIKQDVILVEMPRTDNIGKNNIVTEQYREVLITFKNTIWQKSENRIRTEEVRSVVQAITADASAGITVDGLIPGDEIVGAHVICTAANASGTLVVEDSDGNDITDGMICAVDKVVVYAGTIDDAYSTIPAAKTAQIISVGGTAADTRGVVVIDYIPA